LDPAAIISVDETCLYVHPRHRSGYAKRGRRLHVPLHHTAIQVHAVVGGQQLSGVKTQVPQGSVNSQTYASFVRQLQADPSHTHLMDNVTFHESKVVKEALAAKNLTALYSPPYSPECDPVEMAFFGVQSPHACEI
jgi:hypothetical protein